MRTQNHIIDSKAVKKVINALPDHWVVRELTERDYGIDLMVEIFVPGLKDSKGKDAYDSNGAVFHIQIKGQETPLVPKKNTNTINYSFDKKSLQYIEKFNVPFFLFRADVSGPTGKIYYVWIQRYIQDVLDVEDPSWRENKPASATIRIPVHNELSSPNFEHIGKIAARPKYIEELVEFRDIYADVSSRVDAILHHQHARDAQILADLTNRAHRVRRLPALLEWNHCCVRASCVDDWIQYLIRVGNSANITATHQFQHARNFELLAESLEGINFVENFVAEVGDGRTVY